MITADGKVHIRRFMAGQVGNIAEALAIGVGGRVESTSEKSLQLEIARVGITYSTFDFVGDYLVFKASIPAELSGQIYEVGLWSTMTDSLAGQYGSTRLFSFDSGVGGWSTGTYQVTNSRVGTDALRLNPAASATATSTLNGLFLDLSGYSSADTVKLAYYVGNAFTANVKLRFKNDASNYYEFTVLVPGVGYQISELSKGAATTVGSPTWNNIVTVEVAVTSTAGGAAQVDFDAARIEDADNLNPEYVLVCRELLDMPYVKEAGKIQDIEFAMPVSTL